MSSRPTRGAARLAAILDALPDALLLVNSNGTVVDANKAAVESLQAPGTSLVGRGVLDLLPEFDPSRIPGSMRPPAAESEGLDKPVRMTARRTDGDTFPVEVSGNDFSDDGSGGEDRGYVPYDPYREGSGQDLLLLLVRDLTGRLGIEAELRRQHKQTEMILRAAAEGVLGVDLEGRVVLVNPAAAHILDYRASELGGRELHPLIQHSQADGTPLALEASALLDTLVSGRKHRVRGAVLWRKDGTPVTVDLTTAPVRDGEQLVGAVMTFTDRTKELALVARNEHLTAVLETELGDALTALHRRIDALAGDPAGQLWPEANWTLRRLADECRRFGTLIDGVLAHQAFEASVETGKQQLKRRPVGLDTVVQRAVERAGELVGPGRVRYSVHAAAVEVTADKERLGRALAHLVADVSGIGPSLDAPGTGALPSLGVPALPPAGGDTPMVVVAAAQRGEVARIEVRGPALRSSPVHLPIARGTVERHGGVLQRHELPGGAGTTYVVELPLDPAAARAAAVGRPSVPKETDTAILPDLPELPSAERREDAPAEQSGTPADRAGAGTATGEHGRRGPIALGPSVETPQALVPDGPAPHQGEHGPGADDGQGGAERHPGGSGPSGRSSDGTTAPEAAAPAPVPGQRTHAPIALGPGPSSPAEGFAGGSVDDLSTPPGGVPAAGQPADGASGSGQESGRPSRRRRGVPAVDETPAGAVPLPGAPEPGLPFYPGLEHALPVGGPPAAAPAVQPTGRRRRLAVPADPGTPVESAAPEAPAPEQSVTEQSVTEHAPAEGPTALPPGRTPESGVALPTPAPPVASAELAPTRSAAPELPSAAPAAPQPVGSGLGELSPPRPLQSAFASAFPSAFPQPAAPAEPAPAAPAELPALPAATGPGSAADQTPAAAEQRTPPRPLSELAPAGVPAPAPAPAPTPTPTPTEQPTVLVPAVDGGPRRLLVWPEPDASTKQALQDRGYRPVIVRSREEVDAQVSGFPAALFVDPLTGPITRTALESLRTAALNQRVPVLVTAGLGQAARDAAHGADPAVLLRALAPRDSESHAPRVLLVESDADIAAAMIASLERRGMHVEHTTDENEAVARASSVQPNLVVMDLLQIRRRRVGLLDWLRANDRLHRTPLVVYTSVDLDPKDLPRLRTGEAVLFLAERSTSDDVQARIVDLLGRIGSLAEGGAVAGAATGSAVGG
ncbi:PAS domain-containing protein [Kitasatospora sp. NBC_01539]|uniref:PAS domain-containing protein n=1 Tax=Kitasatospora sp. NBC_01539 TaxID=2903577 RepID=UPI003860265D